MRTFLYEVRPEEEQAISRRIGQARRKAGLTQAKLAELLEVIPRSLQNYERKRVPWNKLAEIARLTNVPLEWLLHGDPTPSEDDPSLRQLALLEESVELQRELLRLARLARDEEPPEAAEEH